MLYIVCLLISLRKDSSRDLVQSLSTPLFTHFEGSFAAELDHKLTHSEIPIGSVVFE